MQTTVRWSETAAEVNGIRPPINSFAFSPSGDQIVAACGVRVLVYSASTGTLLHSLQGHSDTVYCVDYASDGKRFASGGADNIVVIWSDSGEGTLKYQHKQSIQAIACNPVNTKILSLSSVDWGIWTPDNPKVAKYPLDAKGLCAAWTQDGQKAAIGLIDGTILVLVDGITEAFRIQRKYPVWTLAFNPVRENAIDILAVGSWDQKLSFYSMKNGQQVDTERDLDFDPCSVSFLSDGAYMLVSGSNHSVALYTKGGNKLISVAEAEDWVWCARQRPKMQQFCCGTNDGTISVIDMTATTVHCVYQDQYVFRDGMTNVVLNQMLLDRRMTIPCNDYICKLASYNDRLAVQFTERVVIFELSYDDDRNMRYEDIAQIRKRIDCSSIAIAEKAVIVSKDRRLTMYDFQGRKNREWVMESPIRFLKVAGGCSCREALLIGLQNGQSCNVFLDNPFPTLLVKVNAPILSLDLNSTRSKLAVLDDTNLMQVFDLSNKGSLIFSETNVSAIVWNTDYEGMLAYTTGLSSLNIKVGTLPAYQQAMRGIVISFKANNLYNLYNSNVTCIRTPHSHALYRYIEERNFDAAYKIASYGVTEGDWKMLGMHAMTNLRLDIARRSFTNNMEVRLVELLNSLELRSRQLQEDATEDGDSVLLADILAFQGKYVEASRQFLKVGKENRAIDMYCDLKMWGEARKVCSDQNHLKDLIRQQARWAEDSQNFVEAASLYETCGDYANAIGMLGQSGQLDKLMKMCRALPKSEVALITQCAIFFREQHSIPYALEAYEKVDDNRSLVQLYVELGDWRRAFAILEKCPQLARLVYLPWANWLADNDKFEESLDAFRAAKWPQEAIRMLETLASNSVTCRRFSDAAFYFIHLAEEYGDFEDDERPTDAQLAHRIKLSNECVRRAAVYYAYSYIYAHTTQPFIFDDLKLFRVSRHLCAMVCDGVIPVNIGKAEILYTLARAANRLDMVRTARAVFEKLQTVILLIPILEQVDVETLIIRSKPFTDRDELLDTCYRCKQIVPQIAAQGDRCPNCFHPFVRCFSSFVNLPLVEFTLSNDLSDADAERMIRSGIGGMKTNSNGAEDGMGGDEKPEAQTATEWEAENGANVINFEEDNIDYQIDKQLVAMGRSKAAANKGGDPFFTQLQYVTRPDKAKGVYQPYIANAEMIKLFRCDELIVVKPRYGALPIPYRYYRVMKSEISITLCEGCQQFFVSSEYEKECMKGSGCPLCRYKPGRQVSRSLQEVMLDIVSAQEKKQQQ